jgi:hypothetical protein
LLALAVVVMHWPSLRSGRLLDDVLVLDRCEKLSWSALLTEGFEFKRVELGNVWWIEQETILHYFRPLLLVTFRLPMMVFGRSDFVQHAINLLIHLATVGVLLVLARRLFRDPRAAILSALFFAVSLHPRWSILLISARKEPLVGLLLLSAFFLHLRGRWLWAALPFAGALLSGEHAVVFPVMAVLWDVVHPKRLDAGADAAAEVIQPAARPLWPSWALYFGIAGVYVGIRVAALDGMSLPAPPYYNDPLAPGFIPYALLKLFVMAFSLTTTVPYVDRLIMDMWLNHLGVFAGCVVTVVLIVALLLAAAPERRRPLTFLALAGVAFLPFMPMAAIPFYLYTPSIFYALAVGAALDGDKAAPLRNWGRCRKLLGVLVFAAALGNFVITTVIHWGPTHSPFARGPDAPQRIAASVAELLEREDVALDRRILFVNVPSPPPFFYFTYVLSQETGRDPEDLAVVASRPRREAGPAAAVTLTGPRRLLIESRGRPYFDNPVKRLLWFFPEGITTVGRRFERPWWSVTIEAVGEPPDPSDRGHRFFTEEPGITALSVDISPDVPPPVVVGFSDAEPRILFDLAEVEGRRFGEHNQP